MRKITVTILAIITLLSLVNLSFSFSDEVKKEAEKFMRDLNKIALSEGVVKEGPVDLKKEEKLSKRLSDFYNSLPYDEDMMLNIARYFYSKNTPQYDLLGQNMFRILRTYRWEKKYPKPEILLNKLLPIAINNAEPNDLRIEVLHNVADYLDFKKGILKELTSEQIEQARNSLKQIVFDKEYNLPEEKKKYGDVFNVKTQAIDLLAGKFDMDNDTLKQLLELFDTEKDEWTKKKIIWSLSLAIFRDNLNNEGKKMVYDKVTYIVENKDRYNDDIYRTSLRALYDFKDKKALDYLYSLMAKTNDLDTLQQAREVFINNYFVFMDNTKILEREYKTKAREILKLRINDDNSEIRRFCIEELLNEIKDLDKEAKKELKGLFIKAKQKEKEEELLDLLDKGIENLDKDITT